MKMNDKNPKQLETDDLVLRFCNRRSQNVIRVILLYLLNKFRTVIRHLSRPRHGGDFNKD